MSSKAILLAIAWVWAAGLFAQPVGPAQEKRETEMLPGRMSASYVLGPNDVISIRAFEAEEISDKPFRVDGEGYINVPTLGRIHVGGVSVEKLETELLQRLKKFVREPQVVVTIVQFRSEPIFMVGAFRNPGVYPLQGRRTLLEMLTTVGGLQPTASRRIKISRRLEYGRIPLPSAIDDQERRLSEVEVNLSRLMETVNPAEDLVLQPYDIIKVVPKEMIYVSGEVMRTGGYELNDRDSLGVTQVIVMSGGFSREAKPEAAVVLRPVLYTARRAEIPVNLKLVLAGKANDFPLLPNDVLMVPRRRSVRGAVGRAAMYVVPALVTAGIYAIVRR
jgi:polysaccharide export outer membrane protein